MSLISVSVRLADESQLNWEIEESFVHRLESLEGQGLHGRALIDAAISDDWKARPLYVDIEGTLADGRFVKRRIPCD